MCLSHAAYLVQVQLQSWAPGRASWRQLQRQEEQQQQLPAAQRHDVTSQCACHYQQQPSCRTLEMHEIGFVQVDAAF